MIKLLKGYLIRLGKWSIFRIMLIAGMIVASLVAMGLRDHPLLFNIPYVLAYLIFPLYIGILIGLFNYSLFTNGTIKNQMIVGHKRTHIYIADWAASTAFSAAIYLTAVLFLFAVGAAVGDISGLNTKAVAIGVVLSTLHIVLFATINQLFCVIYKGVKSFLAIYIGNQLLLGAAIMLSMKENLPKAAFYFLPTAVCMNLDSFDVPENALLANMTGFSFLPAAAAMLFETAVVFISGVLYFRKTDIN